MDSIGPSAAPTTLYTNVASPAAKPLSSTLSRPPTGGNGSAGGNRTKYHNKNRNSGHGGGHNGKNSISDRGRGGSSGQTTAPPPRFRRQDQRTVADLRPSVAGAHDYVPWPCTRWTVAYAVLHGRTGPLCVS
jgi:hypothetical protein